ncbi:MAG: tRNA pseudouridine(13) synthase TruD [Gammaproteobacteria bacterium]|nr:tRNA pseudouridine(13) synthase TruD [Gammaproteobacteria bacterium]
MVTWPRAFPASGMSAVFKQTPEDFRVDESLDFEISGSGEHLYLFVEKRNLGTPQVADYLARQFKVDSVAVGYAGMKDKFAVARQWFSVHTSDNIEPPGFPQPDMPGLRLLEATRHERKLRRGQVRTNAFTVLLKNFRGDGWADRLDLLATNGVPNYFGPQRFRGDNLQAARAWLEKRRQRRISNFIKGLYRSVLRAFLFNEVVGLRVEEGNWDEPVEGDVLIAGKPSAPLWGRGRSQSSAAALLVEEAALAPHRSLCGSLEYAGVSQQRRAQVVFAESLLWEKSGDEILLSFGLPAGSYATSLLREGFDLDQGVHAGEKLPVRQVEQGNLLERYGHF